MFKIGSKLLLIRTSRRMNQTDFGGLFDMTRPTYAQYENDKKPVDRELLYRMSKALNMSEDDLVRDIGEEKPTLERKPNTETPGGYVERRVPLYDAIAVGGNSMLADQSPISEPIDMVDPGDLLRSATGLLVVRGQSMFPKYPSGCYVAFKRGGDKIPSVIVWGEDYVIELEDRRILKRVEKGETKDHIRAVSYNVNKDNKYVYDPIDIHRNDVKRMYMVLGKVELEASI